MPASILAVIAAMMLVSSARAQERVAPTSKDQGDESLKKVKALQQERIDVLKKQVELLTALFKNARVSHDDVLDAMEMLLNAELEVAETDTARIKLYKNLVDTLRQREVLAERHQQLGRATELRVLKVKARRLEAEIRLEQAKMEAKAAKPGPAPPPRPIQRPQQPPPAAPGPATRVGSRC
jgi:hypothetical protein